MEVASFDVIDKEDDLAVQRDERLIHLSADRHRIVLVERMRSVARGEVGVFRSSSSLSSSRWPLSRSVTAFIAVRSLSWLASSLA